LYLKLLKFDSVAYNYFDVIRFNTGNVVFLRDVKKTCASELSIWKFDRSNITTENP